VAFEHFTTNKQHYGKLPITIRPKLRGQCTYIRLLVILQAIAGSLALFMSRPYTLPAARLKMHTAVGAVLLAFKPKPQYYSPALTLGCRLIVADAFNSTVFCARFPSFARFVGWSELRGCMSNLGISKRFSVTGKARRSS
jgi:hypothetical protein